MQACPEPGQGNVLIQITKFSLEERLEEHTIGSSSHPAPQPGIGCLTFEELWGYNLQKGQDCSHAQAFVNAPGRKAQQGERRIKLLCLTIDQAGGARAMPVQAITQVQFVDEPNDRFIRAEYMMIKFFQPGVSHLKARDQSPGQRFLLKYHNLLTSMRQSIGCHEAESTATKNGVLCFHQHYFLIIK